MILTLNNATSVVLVKSSDPDPDTHYVCVDAESISFDKWIDPNSAAAANVTKNF